VEMRYLEPVICNMPSNLEPHLVSTMILARALHCTCTHFDCCYWCTVDLPFVPRVSSRHYDVNNSLCLNDLVSKGQNLIYKS
jgi:hypothetical protein